MEFGHGCPWVTCGDSFGDAESEPVPRVVKSLTGSSKEWRPQRADTRPDVSRIGQVAAVSEAGRSGRDSIATWGPRSVANRSRAASTLVGQADAALVLGGPASSGTSVHLPSESTVRVWNARSAIVVTALTDLGLGASE